MSILDIDHPDLVAFYKCDTIDSEVLIDETGTYNAQALNSPTIEAQGKIGAAVNFNENSGYLDNFALAGRTLDAISFWIFLPDGGSPAQYQTIGTLASWIGGFFIGKSDSWMTSDTVISFSLFPQGSTGAYRYYGARGTIAPGWRHVVINWSGSAYEFYIDGEPLTNFIFNSGSGYPTGRLDLGYLKIGERRNSPTERSNHKIDHIRIFENGGAGLLPSQITELYEEGFSFTISGSVIIDALPYSTTVRFFDASTWDLIKTVTTDANGEYQTKTGSDDPVYVIADLPAGYQLEVHGPITPIQGN